VLENAIYQLIISISGLPFIHVSKILLYKLARFYKTPVDHLSNKIINKAKLFQLLSKRSYILVQVAGLGQSLEYNDQEYPMIH
jgi:hypothetical protein